MKTHCFFCGDTCSILADPKNPNRWRESYECHTSDRGTELSIFKDAVLKVCDVRGDAWAEQVRVRLSDTQCSFDLHTADARYHEDCRKNFMGSRNVSSAKKKTTSVIDRALLRLIEIMKQDTSKVWSSVEMHQKYVEIGGTLLRRTLVKNISEELGNQLLVLSSPGIADILIFKEQATSILKVEEEYEDLHTRYISKCIVDETKGIAHSKEE